MKVVHENVHQMEECVNKAENDMGSFSLKKMFSSIVGTVSQLDSYKPVFCCVSYAREIGCGILSSCLMRVLLHL